MIEYWLQKKTIGGWSNLDRHDNLDKAKANFLQCVGNGLSGYSWRLVECSVIEQAMLNDVMPIPEVTVEIDRYIIGGKSDKLTWGDIGRNRPADILVQDAPKTRPWGQAASEPENIKIINPGANTGLSKLDGRGAKPGSICLIHHSLQKRMRAMPEELDMLLLQGWVRGGPRTQFE